MGTETKHILVIRLSAMGDVAMTVPVLHTFTNTYPNVKLTVLTRKFFEPIFDGVHNTSTYVADVNGKHKGIFGLHKLARELKKLDIDAVADLHNVLRSKVLKSIFQLSRIKIVQIDKGRKEKKALTRSEHKFFKPLKTTHQRYADVFEKLGLPIDLNTHVFPKKRSLNQNVISLTKQSNKKWLGIAPFAQYEGKTYPLELMVKVIGILNDSDQYHIFLFGGGKREKDILNNIASKFSNATNIVGRLSFEEELSLISNLDVMLAMDSGNAHLAAMYGVPTVTIWGVTHPYAGFAPFMQPDHYNMLPDLEKYDKIPTSIYGNKFPSGYEKVMHSISPDSICKRIFEIS